MKQTNKVIEYVAVASELVGVYLVGEKTKWAFTFLFVCNLAWLWTAYQRRMWPLFAMMWGFITLNVWNFIKWSM